MEGYLAQIMFMALTFTPRTWAACDGRIVSIASNTALFSLLGTTYGGNGTTTFALPDLRGRVPIGQGGGPGLSSYTLGQMGGTETVTLTLSQLPAHNHGLNASSATPTTADPSGAALPTGSSRIYASGAASIAMHGTSVGATGSGQPHDNMQPYLVLNPVICTAGIFPSRS